jgi:PIN domain nuclease of toxin-antitoxin system
LSGYLLDTHTLIWWFEDSPRLTSTARDAMLADGASVYVSAASTYELANQHRLGRLPRVSALLDEYAHHLGSQGFIELAVSAAHAREAGLMAIAHRDPFDRLLIAQARIEDLTLLSNEKLFEGFGVKRIW